MRKIKIKKGNFKVTNYLGHEKTGVDFNSVQENFALRNFFVTTVQYWGEKESLLILQLVDVVQFSFYRSQCLMVTKLLKRNTEKQRKT